VLLTIFSALLLFTSSLTESPADNLDFDHLFVMDLESTAASISCLPEMVFHQARVDVPGQRLVAVTAIAVDGDAAQSLFS
jgi:hypothetical protein